MFIVFALGLFLFRTFAGLKNPLWLLVVESDCWIFAVLALGHKHLNHYSKALSYLSEAAYPVYILHMIFLFLGSLMMFPLNFPVQIKFFAVLIFTFAGCFGTFEIIRRVTILRPLFGLKIKGQVLGSEGNELVRG
jgi:hypothetical protein